MITASFLMPLALALLTGGTPITPKGLSSPHAPRDVFQRCGHVSEYYGQHEPDWDVWNTSQWLDHWWDKHDDLMAANPAGFAGAFGQWSMGNPDWSCRDDGSDSDCDLDLCDNRVLNGRGKSTRHAYYVLESVNRLHSYFTGIGEAFNTAALDAALSKDSWATTFYHDKDDKSVFALREALNALAMVVGLGVAFAKLGPLAPYELAAKIGGVLFNGAVTSVALTALNSHKDDTFVRSADLGKLLGVIVTDSLESFTTANNLLMGGHTYNGVDIRAYIAEGAFLEYEGVDRSVVTDQMTKMLVGASINQLYRTQKIFVMGGAACGDNQGIGSGPQEASICRDGKAWYLYYWQENDVISLTSHQWGWVNPPPGVEQLDQGPYAGINVQDIINSSLDAYLVAGFNYNADTAHQRAADAIDKAWANPLAKGAAWEGIFTIPVCDVGPAVDADFGGKPWILQPYGHESRPVWCGPICGNDEQKTNDFLNAANMEGFESPRVSCFGDIDITPDTMGF